jgi:hypothetical protein
MTSERGHNKNSPPPRVNSIHRVLSPPSSLSHLLQIQIGWLLEEEGFRRWRSLPPRPPHPHRQPRRLLLYRRPRCPWWRHGQTLAGRTRWPAAAPPLPFPDTTGSGLAQRRVWWCRRSAPWRRGQARPSSPSAFVTPIF